jgi:hypothetical protein
MVCSTRLDLLHSHFRRLCRTLADVDEWGQVNLLGLLTRYVRTMLLKPSDSGESTDPDLQLLLSCSEPLFMSRNPAVRISNDLLLLSLTNLYRLFLVWLVPSFTSVHPRNYPR